MEFPFFLTKLFKPNEEGLAVLNCRPLKSNLAPTAQGLPPRPGGSGSKLSSADLDAQQIEQVIDTMGALSCKAQDLKVPITSYLKVSGTDSRIYMKVEGKTLAGFLKVGKKRLFFHDKNGIMKEMTPLCVLDFYVHETMQRSGVGKWLFEHMLELEGAKPVDLAYDRPSPKLLGFLRKHYNLVNFIPQNNNYVLFQSSFETSKKPTSAAGKRDPGEEQKSSSSFFKAGKSILGQDTPATTTTMGYVPMYQKKQHSTAGYVHPKERTIQDQINQLENQVKVLNSGAKVPTREGRGTTPIDQLEEVTRAPKGRSYSSNSGIASLLFPGRK